METRFTARCYCGCGQTVEAIDPGFSATKVEVMACDRQRSEGVFSSHIRKTAAYDLAVPASPTRHTSGLVTFG